MGHATAANRRQSWGRGPIQSDIHGSNKRSVDSPAWRHIKMLASLVSDDGNTPLIEGFYEGMLPIESFQEAELKTAAQRTDLKIAAQNVGVGRFISDDPFTMLKMQRYGTSFNLDGIWGGNMYAGGAGAILPNKVTSKHNFRYVPNMTGPGIVKKLRAQLDKNGYKDVEMKLIGDVPWSRGSSPNTDITAAWSKASEHMQAVGLMGGPEPVQTGPAPRTSAANRSNDLFVHESGSDMGGYWPSYLWTDGEVGEKVGTIRIPMGMGGPGGAGGLHAARIIVATEPAIWRLRARMAAASPTKRWPSRSATT